MRTYLHNLTGSTVTARNFSSAKKKLEKSWGAWIDPSQIIDVTIETKIIIEEGEAGDADSVYLKAAK